MWTELRKQSKCAERNAYEDDAVGGHGRDIGPPGVGVAAARSRAAGGTEEEVSVAGASGVESGGGQAEEEQARAEVIDLALELIDLALELLLRLAGLFVAFLARPGVLLLVFLFARLAPHLPPPPQTANAGSAVQDGEVAARLGG